ncbi:MAG: glycosyltransferase family 4 protein [Dermatophilaceae bacterium]
MHSPSRAGSPRALFIGAEWFTELPGGLNRYLADLLAALTRNGASTTAVVLGPTLDAPPNIVGAGSPGQSLPRRLLAVRRAAARAGRDADVVDVHFALYGLLPVLTTRLRRLPLVVHFHGPWADESALARGRVPIVLALQRAVERAVCRRARAVVVLSEAFGRLVVDRYGVVPSRVHVIPPGVDLERFCTGDRAVARARFDLPAGAFVAVTARRLDPRMGLDVLLDAWAQVQQARPDAVLLLAGDGAERERLTAQAAALPDPSGVRLLGGVSDEDLVRLYQAADCSVVPTRALEGFGLVTLESLACGTPAVVTDVGGLPDGVRGLDPSLIVPAEDPAALSRRLIEAAQGQLSSRASCRAHAEGFGWADVARAHARLYEEVSGRRPMRVVYLDHTAVLSGGELALARLLPALDGVEPHVILADNGPLAGRLQDAGVSVEVLAMASVARQVRRDRIRASRLPLGSVVATAAYVVRLARRLRRLRPDLAHTNSLKAALYGGLAARLAGVPVVWHIRDRITDDYLPPAAVWLVRALARWVPAGVIANSQSTLDTLGPLPCPTAVVPSPIDPALLERPRPQRGDRPFTAAMVGRLAPWKGQQVFLEAFAKAFPTGPECALVVGGALFGETDYERELSALTARLGLTDRVEFTGHVDDVAAELDRADVLVHASVIPEPFGLVVVEAMAAGLPVIAADAGGPAEVITHGVDGLLYAAGDREVLSSMLAYARKEKETLAVRLGTEARVTAQRFAPTEVAADILTLYRMILRRTQ